MDGWTRAVIRYFLWLAFPKLLPPPSLWLESLRSPQRLTCVFDTCLKCSCLSLVKHTSSRICSKRLLSLGQFRHTERRVRRSEGMFTGVFVQPAAAIILNPALVVVDKHPSGHPGIPTERPKCLLQKYPAIKQSLIDFSSAGNLQMNKKKDQFDLPLPLYTFAFVCVSSCFVRVKEKSGQCPCFCRMWLQYDAN